VQCPESLRVQAYFDAELDAVNAADIERHIEHCADCRALLKDLEQMRAVLRRDSSYARAAPALRAKIMRALDQEGAAATQASGGTWTERVSQRRPRSFWMGALGGAGGTAIAATLAFLLLVPRLTNPLLDELVSAHVRSLMPAHLIDVVSTDKHTVKPWFAGHTDVSPVVADFEAQGYRLIGGRADYLDHQRSAVVVYQHGAHVINVFSWAGNERALPDNATRSGYHLAFWREGDLDYCAVSDTGWDELLGLVRLLRDTAAGVAPGAAVSRP
jgi:anti-sigma factor RsiW